jgi:peptidyl-tRNA hydrolase, PTH1 family
MLLIAGLGNPGAQYAGHRHNIGFMCVDAIASAHRFGSWRARFNAEVCEGTLDGKDGPVKTLLMKPQTYMNDSGRALSQAVKFYKTTLRQTVVIYDELDLAPGKCRVKTGGGSAGHNGIKSVSAHLGADFRRVRLGIGHPGDKTLVHPYVLSNFGKGERAEWVDKLIEAVAAAAPCLARNDDAGFMNKIALMAPAPEIAPKSAKEG